MSVFEQEVDARMCQSFNTALFTVSAEQNYFTKIYMKSNYLLNCSIDTNIILSCKNKFRS